ncbi:MAG: GNAT family N-acetyltransferase [Mycobacteriales bacterium]|nr:GNAT family N-acetyltransferase [Frankia sp.]
MTVTVFRTLDAPDEQRRALWQLQTSVEAEGDPSLPTEPYDEWLMWQRRPPEGMRRLDLVVRDGDGTLLGAAQLDFDEEPERPERCELAIAVRPESRRRGVGTELLRAALAAAERDRRKQVATWQPVGGPGDGFLTSLGLHTGQVEQRNVLTVTDVDAARYESWREPAAGYRLVRWETRCPDDLVDAYALARRAMADAPLGEMDYAPTQWTAARVRTLEGMRSERGQRNWVTAAVQEETDEIAGYTEILGSAHWPEMLHQEDTAVAAAHRGHGLGRTVKAANALWVLGEWPAARWVQTWNADENAHMVAVNRELGYRRVAEWGAWQADIADLVRQVGSAEAVAE